MIISFIFFIGNEWIVVSPQLFCCLNRDLTCTRTSSRNIKIAGRFCCTFVHNLVDSRAHVGDISVRGRNALETAIHAQLTMPAILNREGLSASGQARCPSPSTTQESWPTPPPAVGGLNFVRRLRQELPGLPPSSSHPRCFCPQTFWNPTLW